MSIIILSLLRRLYFFFSGLSYIVCLVKGRGGAQRSGIGNMTRMH